MISKALSRLGWQKRSPWAERAAEWVSRMGEWVEPAPALAPEPSEFARIFDARQEGAGIWKWRHYFEVYDRYFRPFKAAQPCLLEVGIFSGGSLDMWQAYFGAGARVIGVDIEPACKAYEREGVEVLIGDQADRRFWRAALTGLPPLDLVLDDGGHQTEQQVVTFEEVFPHIAPGGIYICEDVHRTGNGFFTYMSALANELNSCRIERTPTGTTTPASPVAKWIRAIHFYPFMVVVERNHTPVEHLVSEKRGTQWQPFLT